MQEKADKVKEALRAKGREALKKAGIDIDALKKAGPITKANLPWTIYQNPNILDERLRNKLIEKIKNFSTSFSVDVVTGIAFNLLAKRFYPGISRLPRIQRLTLRWTLFTLPFGGTYPTLKEDYGQLYKVGEAAVQAIERSKKVL